MTFSFPIEHYKLADFFGVAGASIGVIIADGILLGMVVARYAGIFERYRILAGELRGNEDPSARRDHLQKEVVGFRRQLYFLNNSATCLSVALLIFLFAVADAALSVVFPDSVNVRVFGSAALFLGLTLMGVGLALALAELWIERAMIWKESADLNNLPPVEVAKKR